MEAIDENEKETEAKNILCAKYGTDVKKTASLYCYLITTFYDGKNKVSGRLTDFIGS